MTHRALGTAGTALVLLSVVLLAACGGDDKGLSRMDVEEIVRSELAAVQERQSNAAPPRYMPEEYTKFLVREAIGRYESDGRDATLAHYNSVESIDGQWYVFIGEPDGAFLAHAANPDLVNRPVSDAVGPNEYPVGEAVAAVADEDGEWFSYTYPNPDTGAVETKHSWMVSSHGLVFGSGWYERGPKKSDPAAYTQAFVRQALNLYDAMGLEDTLAYYNSSESIDGQWYVFIGDRDDVLVAHAFDPDLVGRHASEVVGPNNYPSGLAVLAVADQDGEWFSYTYPNPATGTIETKHSWIVAHDGLVFGSGWYEAGPPKSDTPAYTRALVQQALNLYDALGLEDTVAYYSSEVNVDGPWYVFIIGEDGRIIAHYDPERMGLDAGSLTDSAGRLYGPELVGATEEGEWVDYVKLNPETGQEQQKYSWVVRHDGLVFGSGWYER